MSGAANGSTGATPPQDGSGAGGPPPPFKVYLPGERTDENRGGEILAICVVLTILAIGITVLRVWVRRKFLSKLSLDDYSMVMATVSYVFFFSVIISEPKIINSQGGIPDHAHSNDGDCFCPGIQRCRSAHRVYTTASRHPWPALQLCVSTAVPHRSGVRQSQRLVFSHPPCQLQKVQVDSLVPDWVDGRPHRRRSL